MTLEELNIFIANAKRLHQEGHISKEDRILMLTKTDYKAGKFPTKENKEMIAQMKIVMDAAIAEAQQG